MITLRRSEERGHAQHGWLDSRFTFSFAEYHDPRHMGFRALRVINDDRIQAGEGFPTHPHQDMEILTYVLEGAVAHRDSTGTSSVIRPGEVQRMSAGTGVRHSEFNASRTEGLHLLQIWILPERRGLPPSYEQKAFPAVELQGRLRLVADQGGTGGAVVIHQDVALYAAKLEPGQSVTHRMKPERHAWLHVARGSVQLNGQALTAGDGAAASDEVELTLDGAKGAEILLFDLA
jgi:redox-sensitive bicupin YhaK (pirin superfamily)